MLLAPPPDICIEKDYAFYLLLIRKPECGALATPVALDFGIRS
jgi:hypothetical protein